MAITTSLKKSSNPVDYYKKQINSTDQEMQKLMASRYGSNYQKNPNYNADLGLAQPNVQTDPNYSNNIYQQQIDMNTYLGAMQNQEHAQSALDQYRQLANTSYSAKQEAEIQRQQAQLHMGNIMQNQGLGNQGISESTQAKIMNQYANQTGNIDLAKGQKSQDILGQYRQAVSGVNRETMLQNAELSSAMQQEQAEQNLTQLQNEISKYITVDEATGSIKDNKFNTLEEIDQFFAKYQGMAGINKNELNSDYETIRNDFITKKIKPNMNKPLTPSGDIKVKIDNLQQQGVLKDGTIVQLPYTFDGYQNYIYIKGTLYPVTNSNYKNKYDYAL